jgi:hypothetical protein
LPLGDLFSAPRKGIEHAFIELFLLQGLAYRAGSKPLSCPFCSLERWALYLT